MGHTRSPEFTAIKALSQHDNNWNISVKAFIKNIYSGIAIKANFPFPIINQWKLSCHRNEITQPTAIKIIIFVEANQTNISAKF